MEYGFDVQKLNSWFTDICEKYKIILWMRDLSYQKQLYISPNYETLWDRPITEIYEHPNSWYDTLVDKDILQSSSLMENRKNNIANILYYRVSQPKGEMVYICDKSFQLVDSTGKAVAIAGIGQNLTSDTWIQGKESQTLLENLDLITFFEEVIKKSLGLFLPQCIVPFPEEYKIIHAGRTYFLSPREAQCLCYSSAGYSAKEIAKKINISHRTVETYLENLRQKTNSRNKLQLLGQLDATPLNLLREKLL